MYRERQFAVEVVASSFVVELDVGKGCKTKAVVSVVPFLDIAVVDIDVVVTAQAINMLHLLLHEGDVQTVY